VVQFCFAQSTNPKVTNAVEKEIPLALRESLHSGITKLIEYEKAENWTSQADLLSDLVLQGRKKGEWLQERKRSGSFFGRRLLKHRIERIYAYGLVGDDEETGAMVYGCAQLRGPKHGYQTLIEVTREHGEWRFAGPNTISQIDGPAERCQF
jgi:hypothetical protein